MAEENGEIEPYPIDDVIDTVCEWNYELILDADAHRNDPKDFKDYSAVSYTHLDVYKRQLLDSTELWKHLLHTDMY